MKEISELQNLVVGTEVSAKYRGAFCEAQIKSIKRIISLRVLNQKDGKYYNLTEDNVRGTIKVGCTVEAIFPDAQGWMPGHIQSLKDKSSYTVVFDDGDERTLSRGSLCLKGDRHFATSETLDNLPLTDPENFGTPVLSNKKGRSRRRQSTANDEGEESDDSNLLSPSTPKSKAGTSRRDSMDMDYAAIKEKQAMYLAMPMMGCVVIVEPTDKRKHWYPGLVVNPLCLDVNADLHENHFVVRSFKTGKLTTVNKSIVSHLTKSTTPAKVDNQWKDALKDALDFQNTFKIPDIWKMEVDEDKNEENDAATKTSKEEEDVKDKEAATEFLESLYKFMDDRGTTINKTPVLGYKDLNLNMLFRLVQERNGFYSITSRDWHQIYTELGIPKQNSAAAHNTRSAYQKYLLPYEEFALSWKDKAKKSSPAKVDKMEKTRKKKLEAVKKEKRTRKDSKRESVSRAGSRGSSPVSNASTPCSEDTSLPRRKSRRRKISESSSVSGGSPVCSKNENPGSNGKSKLEEKNPTATARLKKKTSSSKLIKKVGDMDSDREDASAATLSEIVTRRIRRNSTNSIPTKYNVGEKLRVRYGEGKSYKAYQAKIIEVQHGDRNEDPQYLVHYAGWNQRHDEWISNSRIIGLVEDQSTTSPQKVGKSVSKSTGTTPAVSPFPGTSAEPRTNKKPQLVKDQIISTLPQPRTSALLKKNPTENTTDILLKARNILGALTSKDDDQSDPSPKLPQNKEALEKRNSLSTIPKQDDENRSTVDDDAQNNISSTLTQKSTTTQARPKSISPKDFPPTAQPRRTSLRRSKSPAYLAGYDLNDLKETSSPVESIKEEILEEKPEFALKDDQKTEIALSLAELAAVTDINKNYIPRNTNTVLPVQDDLPSNRKRSNDDHAAKKNKKQKKSNENDPDNHTAQPGDSPSAVSNIDAVKTSTIEVATTVALLKSNAASVDHEATSVNEEVSRIMQLGGNKDSESSSNGKENKDSENFENNLEESNDINLPSSSKVLMDNTPPHTPEHSNDAQEIIEPTNSTTSDDSKTITGSGEGTSGSSSDQQPASSPEYNKTVIIEEDIATQPKADQSTKRNNTNLKNEKKALHRKRKHRSSKSHGTQGGDSESDNDQTCSNNSTRSKPRKKRSKVRREIPDVPEILNKNELAAMSQDERIDALQRKMEELRTVYQQLKQEAANIDRKRKRAKKREKEASEAALSPKSYDSPRKSTGMKNTNLITKNTEKLDTSENNTKMES